MFFDLQRRPHNEKLNDLYSSPRIIRVIKLRRTRGTGHDGRNGDMRDAYRVFVMRPEVKIQHEDQRRWEVNIKMDIQKTGWGRMDWTDLAQDRGRWRALVNAVMNLRVP